MSPSRAATDYAHQPTLRYLNNRDPATIESPELNKLLTEWEEARNYFQALPHQTVDAQADIDQSPSSISTGDSQDILINHRPKSLTALYKLSDSVNMSTAPTPKDHQSFDLSPAPAVSEISISHITERLSGVLSTAPESLTSLVPGTDQRVHPGPDIAASA
jgi:hypothetical protein